MSDTIASLGSISDSTYGKGKSRQRPGEEGHEKTSQDGEPSEDPNTQDLRLIIEDDHPGEAPVYKTVDRRTGMVVQSLDGEEVLHLGEAKNYVAGQLIKTRV
jgi:hypothetical protein